LDEITLIKHCNSIATDNVECKSHAISKFRYFVLENSIILALFEEPLGNSQGKYILFSNKNYLACIKFKAAVLKHFVDHRPL